MTGTYSSSELTPAILTLGPWLKQRRRVMDLTQDELAQRATCSLATIRKIEAGDLMPSKQLAQQLAVALDIAPADHAAFVAFARAERATVMATAFSAPPAESPSFLARPAESTGRRHRIPAPLTPLVGREWEIQASCTLLRRPVARLFTLTGPPGSGKTRLALALAEALQAEYANGALFVPLATVTNPQLVAPAIAQALGVRIPPGTPPLQLLIDELRDQQLLIVLDNFEQLIDAAPLLAELLMAAAGLKLIITSRSLLRLYGEHELPVPPLPLPTLAEIDQTSFTADDLLLYPAVDLFVQRAQAVQPTFALTDDNAHAIVQLCAWVEGLPLAIEMAAALVKWHTPQALIGQLSHRLAALSNGPRFLAPRQQTLRGAIEWSYNLLTADEQQVFEALAVFHGGCTDRALTSIFAMLGNGTLGTTTLGNSTLSNSTHVGQHLPSLVDHSLVMHQPMETPPPRYVMLETLREYALEKLHGRGLATTLQHAHATYFFELAQSAVAHGAAKANLALHAEAENLRAALAWWSAIRGPQGEQLAQLLNALELG